MKTVLVTGGCGFIGSHLVRYLLSEKDLSVINLDALTYAGNPDNLVDIEDNPRYRFIRGDICNGETVAYALKTAQYVIHCAAETHVDRSITGSAAFIQTNIVGTHVLLEEARNAKIERLVHVSTDEVYGSLTTDEPAFTEDNLILPNSPYSASKASSDLLVRSYVETYGFPGLITRCSNNYGPFQFPEKFLPVMIMNALAKNPMPVYGDGMNVRDWLYVGDHCRAIAMVLEKGVVGEVYNIGGDSEQHNINMAKLIVKKMGRDESLITFVEDRLGHDRRYAINAEKIKRDIGWVPRMSFEDGIELTVDWYRNNREWIERIQSGEYQGCLD